MWGRSERVKGISVSGYVLLLLLLFNALSSLLPLTSSLRSWAFLWIFYTNTILQMSEWKNIKTLALQFYFSPPEGGKKVQERVSFISPTPLSVSSPVSLLSAELSLSLPASFHSILFIFNSQSFSEKKKREWERGKQAERNPEIADGSGIFFSSCSYPSAFELAMWKSARSTALHSSLPLIKSRQSGLNQHAKCHSTL